MRLRANDKGKRTAEGGPLDPPVVQHSNGD